MIIFFIAVFLIAIILVIAEYFLCIKLHSPLWGGIIPVLVLLATIATLASGRVSWDWKAILLLIILNTLCFGDWVAGREQYRKKHQSETE